MPNHYHKIMKAAEAAVNARKAYGAALIALNKADDEFKAAVDEILPGANARVVSQHKQPKPTAPEPSDAVGGKSIREKIIDHLAKAERACRIQEVANSIGHQYSSVASELSQLAQKGKVHRLAEGRYEFVSDAL